MAHSAGRVEALLAAVGGVVDAVGERLRGLLSADGAGRLLAVLAGPAVEPVPALHLLGEVSEGQFALAPVARVPGTRP